MGESIRGRFIVVVSCVVVALLFLLPTIVPAMKEVKWITRPLSLGLDLVGGVHLVYEVDAKEAVRSSLQAIGNDLKAQLREDKVAVTKITGSDKGTLEITLLSDRLQEKAKDLIRTKNPELQFQSSMPDGERIKLIFALGEMRVREIEQGAVSRVLETLRNRVDAFGVSEPLIQRAGERRIMLQMPGASDIESVKKVVGSVAKLEFRLVPQGNYSGSKVKLKQKQGGTVELEEEVLMTGDSVQDAMVSIHDTGVKVDLVMTPEGTRLFKRITTENIGRSLAIVLDGIVYSAPVIRDVIANGRAEISGSFTSEEATQLKIVLRAGALPAPLHSVEERTVGPTLGKESIAKGITAVVMSFVFIFVFLLWYYKKAGVVAAASLVLNLFFLVSILAAFGATLTLPGIAGLALTIGMAVDSNVIIFERIRDELRNGSSRSIAVAAGFDKAFTAIFDSNVTTLISATLLYVLGSGPIRGFAVSLSIGVLTTVLCATFVARLMFDAFPLKGKGELSIW